MVVLFLRNPHTVLLTVLHKVTFPPTGQRGSAFSTFPSMYFLFDCLILAILTCVRWYRTVFFTYLVISDVEHLFVCILAICMSSLEKCLFRSSAQFVLGCLSLILSYMSCLYIWEMNPLFVASFTNMFFHSVGCRFVLSMVPFAVQKHLSLLRSCLFLLLFVITLVVGSKKYCCHFCQRVFCRCSPLRTL